MNKILKIFSNKKILLCSILLVVCVIGLIVLKSSSTESSAISESGTELSSDDYINSIETRIENIVQSVKGVKNAKCLVYTNSSIEIEYAYDTTESNVSDSEYQKNSAIVFEKNGSKQVPVVIKKTYPKIVGILVVASGVEDEKTRISIVNALASVFDININSIEVLSGN